MILSGCITTCPGLRAAYGPWIGHTCAKWINALTSNETSFYIFMVYSHTNLDRYGSRQYLIYKAGVGVGWGVL